MPNHLIYAVSIATILTGCTQTPDAISGVVEVDKYVASAEIGGRLVSLSVKEGDKVEAGEVVATIDCEVQRLKLQGANADVRQATSQLALLEEGATPEEIQAARAMAKIAAEQLKIGKRGATRDEIRQLQAALQAVEAKLKLAATSVARTQKLVESGVGVAADLDKARANQDVLTAERDRLSAGLDQAKRGVRVEKRQILEGKLDQAKAKLEQVEKGARTQELAMASAAVDGAKARYAVAQTQVDHCDVRAPIGGRIDILNYQVGELLAPGAKLALVTVPKTFTFRTYARQMQIGRLDTGDIAHVFIDGYPDAPLAATITRVYETPEFTTSAVQTSDDRMLLVYRVELSIEERNEVPLRAGMTGLTQFGAETK